jgi:hypothetical protein
MNLDRMANLTSSLRARPSRREMMRGLMAMATATGQTCQPGTSIGSVSVPAIGSDVRTPVLAEGQRYYLRASGFWYTNATHGNDAFASFLLSNHGLSETTYQGVRLGLAVDDGSPDEWGSYHVTHLYEREVVGQGKTLKLQYTDPKTNDNSGSMTVDIVCA